MKIFMKIFERLYLLWKDFNYFILHVIDPIPPYYQTETIDHYVYRIHKKHALRYLEHAITHHFDINDITEAQALRPYHRKKDKKILKILIKMIAEIQRKHLILYQELSQ